MHAPPLLLPALALLLFCQPVGAQDKIVLRQHWEPGKLYRFETNMDIDMTVPGLPGGGAQTTSVIQQMEVTVRKEQGSDRRLVDAKFTGIKAMMNAGGQLMTYDSSDPAMSQPMLQQTFGALVDKSITFIYDKDDKFIDAIVPESFTSTPVGQARGPDGKQFATMLRESVDFGLPPQGVAVGEAFTVEKKIQMQPLEAVTSRMKGRVDSMVTHQGRKHAKVVMEGTMDMPELPPGTQRLVSPISGTKVSTEILFDLERKAVSLSTGRSDMKMSIAGREMTMKQTIVSTLKSIEDAPPARK